MVEKLYRCIKNWFSDLLLIERLVINAVAVCVQTEKMLGRVKTYEMSIHPLLPMSHCCVQVLDVAFKYFSNNLFCHFLFV